MTFLLLYVLMALLCGLHWIHAARRDSGLPPERYSFPDWLLFSILGVLLWWLYLTFILLDGFSLKWLVKERKLTQAEQKPSQVLELQSWQESATRLLKECDGWLAVLQDEGGITPEGEIELSRLRIEIAESQPQPLPGEPT